MLFGNFNFSKENNLEKKSGFFGSNPLNSKPPGDPDSKRESTQAFLAVQKLSESLDTIPKVASLNHKNFMHLSQKLNYSVYELKQKYNQTCYDLSHLLINFADTKKTATNVCINFQEGIKKYQSNILVENSLEKSIVLYSQIENFLNTNLHEFIFFYKDLTLGLKDSQDSKLNCTGNKSDSRNLSQKIQAKHSLYEKRLRKIIKSIGDLEKKAFVLDFIMKKNKKDAYELWDNNLFEYTDPDHMKTILNPVFQSRRSLSTKKESQPTFTFTKSKLLEKSNLQIKIETSNNFISSINPNPKKIIPQEKPSISKILQLKDILLSKIQNENKDLIKEPKGPKLLNTNEKNVPLVNIPQSIEQIMPEESKKKSDNIPSFNPVQNFPQVSSEPKPFSPSGFGQPTSFGAPSNLPSMAGLANKSFGSNAGQGFSGFAGPSATSENPFQSNNPTSSPFQPFNSNAFSSTFQSNNFPVSGNPFQSATPTSNPSIQNSSHNFFKPRK
jgi:hypothetical protein